MGNFGGTSKNHRVKGVSTAFWAVVLLGSTVSIAAGFAGGRTVVAARALPPPAPADRIALPPPVPIVEEKLERVLSGVNSLDGAEEIDPYGDPTLAVAEHPWPATSFDGRRDRAKLAVIIADASRAGHQLDGFVRSALPFTLVVAPSDDAAAQVFATARSAGKAVLVDASSAKLADVAGFVRDAQGVLASVDRHRARALLATLHVDTLLVDAALHEDDALPAAARAKGWRVLSRDVIADARDERAYVDFMLRDALAIAQRHGSAIVIVHARAETLSALERFAERARRAGADVVPITELSA
jgi:polysaccharide deacetylase 2 family uncharacterized protein YibQ